MVGLPLLRFPLPYPDCPPDRAPTHGYSCKQTGFFSVRLSLKLLMNVLAKADTETLLLWLITWENVGCSELIQIKGELEAKAGDHRDSLQTTIKPSTSPAIGTGWGWKRMEILRGTCKIGCNSTGFIFKPRICTAMSSIGTSPHWKRLQDMP